MCCLCVPLKVSVERELSEQVGFLEPIGGGKSVLAGCYVKEWILLYIKEFVILRPRSMVERIFGQLKSRTKLSSTEKKT
jgi:hypothetical protein